MYFFLFEQNNRVKKRVRRRIDTELNRCYHCPYTPCGKEYASDFALNLHIKNKHNGGSKKDRDETAVFFFLSSA